MKPNPIHSVLIVGLLLLLADASRADDWPQWREPNRDGVWRETGIRESVPPGELKILWRAPVAPGFSSPVVAQGRVYLIHSELMLPNAQERVQCFDAANGRVLWTFSYDVSYPDWVFTPEPGMGPAATPIITAGGKRQVIVWTQKSVMSLDPTTGKEYWHGRSQRTRWPRMR